jgi:hypothetical protein
VAKAKVAVHEPPNGAFQTSFSGGPSVVYAGPWPGVGVVVVVCACWVGALGA